MLKNLKIALNIKKTEVDPHNESDFPFFSRLFMSSATPINSAEKQENLKKIKESLGKVKELQNDYQPAYGLLEDYPSVRQSLLERNCDLIINEIEAKGSEQQIRILDVGCNCGYTSMKIAETFPNTIGLDIQKDLVTLCNRLAANAGSTARFYDVDLFSFLLDDECDFESIDALLLLNVMHQIIFHYGFDHAKALLFKILSRVDYVFVELAKKEDYIKHGKDHLLPERPEDLLDGLQDHTIKKLADHPRPLYFIKKSHCSIGGIHIQYTHQDHSKSKSHLISRKYYSNKHHFLKVFRFTYGQSSECYERELNALFSSQQVSATPRLIDWTRGKGYGAILMSQLPGHALTTRIYSKTLFSLEARENITAQYITLNRQLHETIGFHNDLQPHNIYIDSHDNLFVFDFEQANPLPQNDPYGILLWSLFDIWGGRVHNRPECIASLKPVIQEKERSRSAIYPDFSTIEVPTLIKDLVHDAMTSDNWEKFIKEWDNKLSQYKYPISSQPQGKR